MAANRSSWIFIKLCRNVNEEFDFPLHCDFQRYIYSPNLPIKKTPIDHSKIDISQNDFIQGILLDMNEQYQISDRYRLSLLIENNNGLKFRSIQPIMLKDRGLVNKTLPRKLNTFYVKICGIGQENQNEIPEENENQPTDPNKDMIGWIEGLEDSLYSHGRFHLSLKFSSDFPYKPPEIKFVTSVYYPNISPKGEICLDILHPQWSSALTIRGLLIVLSSLFTNPKPERGINKEALHLYRTDKLKYEETANNGQ